MRGLDLDAFRVWAPNERGLDYFVYSDLTITKYSQSS